VVRKLRRAILRDEPTYYDMYENKGEQFFARLYLHQIEQILQSEGLPPALKILEAGCQAGRLAVPLAKQGHQVTGVDTSGLALRRARAHARQAHTSLRLFRADLTRWLPRQRQGSFDVVLCTEVLYLRPNYKTLLYGLIRLIRPGGLCFISHRPTAYYAAEALQHQDWQAIHLVATCSEGIFRGSYFNWQSRQELEKLYQDLQVEVSAITPIGFISWLTVNPAELDPGSQDALFKMELECQQSHPDTGRYLLVSGRKR
jgi:2-polyprenyl-3-methyl-5-hydroxy-6-metoxy-1,4-benzoquinol methylase